MNTTHKNNSIGKTLFGSFLMVALVATLSFGFVQTAHAQYEGDSVDYGGYGGGYTDYGGGGYGGGYSGSYDYGYNGGCCDYSSYEGNPTTYSYEGTPTSYSYEGEPTNYGGYTYVPDNYSYSSGSSFSLGLGGGGYGGYGGYGGGYSYGGYGGGGYTNVNSNYNYNYASNTCVGTGNCNNINTTITNPSPTVTYTNPSYSYPSYPSYSYSQPYTPPVIISGSGSTNPYISLSSIPYTGLELGFWGTIAYWGFVILWCLFAAYLIVVKRVHNKFMNFLFGGRQEVTVTVAHTSQMPKQNFAAVSQNRSESFAQALTNTNTKHDPIDSFIMGQIQNRARA